MSESVNEDDVSKYTTPSTTTTELVQSYTKKMTNIIYPLVDDYDEIDRDLDMYEIMPSYQEQKPRNTILNLTPTYGTLLPFECQVISITFTPKIGRSINTTCDCYVEGGEMQTLEITGSCMNICYKINKTVIEVGLQVSMALNSPKTIYLKHS